MSIQPFLAPEFFILLCGLFHVLSIFFSVTMMASTIQSKVDFHWGRPSRLMLIAFDSAHQLSPIFSNRAIPKTPYQPSSRLIYWCTTVVSSETAIHLWAVCPKFKALKNRSLHRIFCAMPRVDCSRVQLLSL
ncbi:hypothetical protein METBIDRAFT_202573 [Metschnikowia bicuspidata var. bicuspidata NRRL YB-4993]|uniref:Uncharacterized protein n=1 Tax=Metschnikowia bicuspidata var. bicuspidata NRRL YB-4993 TaxID=869754 RepID=A0A1A0H959_9ASCO|nr:hypothetical protein METBIDRAFT_202573 [Metschnikowia bicuspidata var. bicuspidata NRRL YB-4993]OBA20659.1 hypothetical protein METBIDRAFT_202573 [Metschnikowia bicuspidata var. bicuspidata NRRL YB-4993]